MNSRVLVLGHSNSSGAMLEDAGDSWPAILQRELPARTGHEVEVVHRIFYASRDRDALYAERLVRESSPNLVIVGLTSHEVTFALVRNRIRRLFGERVARWYTSAEVWFDARTAGSARPLRTVNSGARWLARHTIGRETQSSHERVVGAYGAVLKQLALHEELSVVVMSGSYHSARLHSLFPDLVPSIRRFNEDIRATAVHHRLAWADQESALERGGNREVCFPPGGDGIHKSPLGARRIADLLLDIVTAELK